MSVDTDPALYASGYERMENERYWTEPWVTGALLRRLGPRYSPVWEPAAGRGDMARVLMNHDLEVVASDVDMSEFDVEGCAAWKHDFLRDDPLFLVPPMVITNPPYGGGDRHMSEKFVHRALGFEEVRVVAMLLRSEFKSAGRRRDLFEHDSFAYEIVLTSRPRWDWWFRDKPKNAPRHNFSWFVWMKDWDTPPTMYFEGKEPL